MAEYTAVFFLKILDKTGLYMVCLCNDVEVGLFFMAKKMTVVKRKRTHGGGSRARKNHIGMYRM